MIMKTKTQKQMKTRTLGIDNNQGKYDGNGDYTGGIAKFEVVKETEKAVQVKRFIN